MSFRAAFYKGTRPGLPGVYNHLVRKWERGPYSHCELIFSDGMSASASFEDKGVRFKAIDYTPENWDFIDLPPHLEGPARAWFEDHDGWSYDIRGNFHHVIGFIPASTKKKFCSSACAEALGMPTAWRFGPNALYAALWWNYRLA